MSIWTSSGRALALALGLSGCVEGGAPFAGGAGTRAIAVSGGAVTVVGPSGYCIDRSSSRDRRDGAFVLFGTCAALSGVPAAGQPAKPAILTAQVARGEVDGAAFGASIPATARFFASPPGREALSRVGNASTVRVTAATSKSDVLYLNIRDSAGVPGAAVERDYWRAILVINGRMVTLSAMSLKDRPLTSSEKRQVLEIFIDRMRAANRQAASDG